MKTSTEIRQRQQRKRAALHHQVAGWAGGPGECGVECECGTAFDGFDSIGEAKAELDRHISGPSRDHLGSGASTHPTPLDALERVERYQRQNGTRHCTDRQWQRIRHKEGRALARGEV